MVPVAVADNIAGIEGVAGAATAVPEIHFYGIAFSYQLEAVAVRRW